MRSAIIGACFAGDAARRREFVLASSRLTHRGWQAETAALAVAECVALIIRCKSQPQVSEVSATIRKLSEEQEWQTTLALIEASLAAQSSVAEFVSAMGMKRGVTGYSLHVVPVAIFSLLRHPNDFRTALTAALDCGGDTDTVGAILGAMIGASVGAKGIPAEWRGKIFEWPRSIGLIEQVAYTLAEQAASHMPLGSVRYFWPALIARNVLFLFVILVHGFRRLTPPY